MDRTFFLSRISILVMVIQTKISRPWLVGCFFPFSFPPFFLSLPSTFAVLEIKPMGALPLNYIPALLFFILRFWDRLLLNCSSWAPTCWSSWLSHPNTWDYKYVLQWLALGFIFFQNICCNILWFYTKSLSFKELEDFEENEKQCWKDITAVLICSCLKCQNCLEKAKIGSIL